MGNLVTDKQSILLLSGGIDSTVLAYHMHTSGNRPRIGLTVVYGQKAGRETGYASRICQHLGIRHVILDTRNIGRLGSKSALIDRSANVPASHDKTTYFPNRNAILLSLASALAVSEGCDSVAIGLQVSPGDVYPDCSEEFVASFQSMQRVALAKPEFEIYAPFIRYWKWDMIKLGESLGVPWRDTWSCYEFGAYDQHCGVCANCATRKRSFKNADVVDLTEYEA